MSEREGTTRTCRIRLRDDGILHSVILPGSEIDEDDALEIWHVQERILGSSPRYSFVDIRGIRSATRKARAVLGQAGRREIMRALALQVGNPISKLVGSFFLGLNKPSYPTKLFTTEEEAIEWLKQQMAAADE